MERQQQQQQSTLCREGCGFFGSAATEGYCSKCYMDHLRRKQSHQHATSTSSPMTDALRSTNSVVSHDMPSASSLQCTTSTLTQDHNSLSSHDSRPKKNRCHVCRKKLGLTGFDCRCGGIYCSLHRYSDTHECTFDYKTTGRQEIAKNNPVVVAPKIHKL